MLVGHGGNAKQFDLGSVRHDGHGVRGERRDWRRRGYGGCCQRRR
jgi:hypothetical protein